MPVLNLALKAFTIGWQFGLSLATKAWGAAITQQVNNTQQAVNDIANTWIWQGVRTAGIWNGQVHDGATRMRTDLLPAFGDIDKAMRYLVNVTIPNSVKAGTHKNWNGINGLRAQVHALVSEEAKTQGEVTRLHQWVNGQVNPYINGWKQFIGFWNHHLKNPIQALVDWYAEPQLLSANLVLRGRLWSFLTPALAKDRRDTDQLARILLRHAPTLTELLDRTAVAVLESGRYPQP